MIAECLSLPERERAASPGESRSRAGRGVNGVRGHRVNPGRCQADKVGIGKFFVNCELKNSLTAFSRSVTLWLESNSRCCSTVRTDHVRSTEP